jgi:hypothetical protein
MYLIEYHIVILFPLTVMKNKVFLVHFMKMYGELAGTSGALSSQHGISSRLGRVA